MNIRTWAGSLCLLTLPLAAAAAEPATSPFPDRPYLLQFKRSLPATPPTPSAPGRGMTPSLSMGPGGSCNPDMSADCERVDIGGAGWDNWGSYAAIDRLQRVELTIKRSERKAALCTVESMECRLYLIPSEVGTIDRAAPEPVLKWLDLFLPSRLLPTCVHAHAVSLQVDEFYFAAKDAAQQQLKNVSPTRGDKVDVQYMNGATYRFTIVPPSMGEIFGLASPVNVGAYADKRCP